VIPAGVGVPFTGEECVFGGDDKVVSIGFKEFTEERLASALVVFIGGVDEIAPGSREAVKDFFGFLFRCGEAPVPPDIAEGHRAQAKFGDPQPAFS
jgi:hypothetical protein